MALRLMRRQADDDEGKAVELCGTREELLEFVARLRFSIDEAEKIGRPIGVRASDRPGSDVLYLNPTGTPSTAATGSSGRFPPALIAVGIILACFILIIIAFARS